LIVVDASVWGSYFYPTDVNHATSRAWILQQIINNTPLISPVLLLSEVGGPVSRRVGQAEAKQAINELRGLQSVFLIDLDETLALTAASLAVDLQLRGADAVYVAVAEQLSLPLVTWDREIINRAAGVAHAQTPN
jgi:predicted nucleic acid-binding protein